MKRIYIIGMAGIISSCGVCHKCIPQQSDVRDSIIIKEVIRYRDSTIYYKVSDTMTTEIAGLKDTVKAETDLAKAQSWIEGDSIKLEIHNKNEKPLPIEITIPEKEYHEEKIHIKKEVQTIEVNRLTKWQKTTQALGYTFIGVVLATILIIILRRAPKL